MKNTTDLKLLFALFMPLFSLLIVSAIIIIHDIFSDVKEPIFYINIFSLSMLVLFIIYGILSLIIKLQIKKGERK